MRLLFEPELIHAQESFLPALRHYGPQGGIATSDEWGVTGFAALIASMVVYAAWSARRSWTDEVRPFTAHALARTYVFVAEERRVRAAFGSTEQRWAPRIPARAAARDSVHVAG
jgi:hypothetical protein